MGSAGPITTLVTGKKHLSGRGAGEPHKAEKPGDERDPYALRTGGGRFRNPQAAGPAAQAQIGI